MMSSEIFLKVAKSSSGPRLACVCDPCAAMMLPVPRTTAEKGQQRVVLALYGASTTQSLLRGAKWGKE